MHRRINVAASCSATRVGANRFLAMARVHCRGSGSWSQGDIRISAAGRGDSNRGAGSVCDSAGDLGNGELVEALAFADAAVSVLLHLQAEAGSGTIHPALLGGVMGRSEVHQATGMLSAQHGVSLAQALMMLQARAYSAERPILDIARDVLGRRLELGNGAAVD